MTAPTAVVLFSGGLDSTTLLAIAKEAGHQPAALTFRYGQTHAIEVTRAREIAAGFGVAEHVELDIPLARIGGSSLVGDGTIPTHPGGVIANETEEASIPSTYVPARNLIFLSFAAGVAEAGVAE